MAEGARVESIDALKAFRIALVKFAEVCNLCIGDAESDLNRTYNWLETEQNVYWQGQIRKRQENVAKCLDALRQKTLFKAPDGSTASSVDEKKNLQVAQRQLEEAKAKLDAVKKWTGRLQKEILLYKGQVQRLALMASSVMPMAVTHLGVSIEQLEMYVKLAGPEGLAAADLGMAGVGGESGAGGGMTRPEAGGVDTRSPYRSLRAKSPTTVIRQSATPGDAREILWLAKELGADARESLLYMNNDPSMVAADETVVIAKSLSQSAQIYLERLEKFSGRDTGWFIGAVDGADTTYEIVPVGNLLTSRPDFRELLSLPKGTLAVLDADGVRAVLDQQDQDIWAKAIAEAAHADDATAAAEKTAAADAILKDAAAVAEAGSNPALAAAGAQAAGEAERQADAPHGAAADGGGKSQ